MELTGVLYGSLSANSRACCFGIFREQFPLTGIERNYDSQTNSALPRKIFVPHKQMSPQWQLKWGFPGGTVLKNLPAKAGDARDVGLIPGSGRSPGGGHDNLLQYSCLGNPMDRGAWGATVYRVSKSWTRLKRLSTPAQTSQWTLVGLGGPESSFKSQLIPVCPSTPPQQLLLYLDSWRLFWFPGGKEIWVQLIIASQPPDSDCLRNGHKI